MNKIITRFAPSPTGHLHVGNVRVALINWLFAKKNDGLFMLRLDDTDKERTKQEYVDSLYNDLKWLGLGHDVFARQSDRIKRYEEVKQILINSNRLYPCYETPDELEYKRKIQLNKGKPPVYDRSSLNATEEQIKNWEDMGRKPHWRFKLNSGILTWNDMIKGKLSFEAVKSLSDPVLIKEDGSFLYTLSSVVDDIDFNITHIIRGEDHITNTAVQIQLFEAIKPDFTIEFGHLSLLFDSDGNPLSKRLNSFCVKNLCAEGIEAMALNCFLVSLGSSVSPTITSALKDLVSNFDLHSIHGGARVEKASLLAINRKILHTMSFEEAKERIDSLNISFNEKEWDVVKESLTTFLDIKIWDEILHQNITFKDKIEEADKGYIKIASELLPDDPLGEDFWDKWFAVIKSKTDRKGSALFHPLRVSLTGLENGPEMRNIITLLTKEIIKSRLDVE